GCLTSPAMVTKPLKSRTTACSFRSQLPPRSPPPSPPCPVVTADPAAPPLPDGPPPDPPERTPAQPAATQTHASTNRDTTPPVYHRIWCLAEAVVRDLLGHRGVRHAQQARHLGLVAAGQLEEPGDVRALQRLQVRGPARRVQLGGEERRVPRRRPR